jgi:16S rRNA (guanine527-N7)-methyltransferase
MIGATEASVAGLGVSRETLTDLHAFEALVQRWSPAINLVSKGSLSQLWSRHVEDSAQIFAACPKDARTWADLGSGGGFPGIVVAVLAKELKPELRLTLVESDLRKATFLRQAAQALRLDVTVLSSRAETIPPLQADVLSARALAPLSDLLGYAERHLAAGGTAIFPKGAQYAAEILEARKSRSFEFDLHPSLSEADAAILVIRNINRAQD